MAETIPSSLINSFFRGGVWLGVVCFALLVTIWGGSGLTILNKKDVTCLYTYAITIYTIRSYR